MIWLLLLIPIAWIAAIPYWYKRYLAYWDGKYPWAHEENASECRLYAALWPFLLWPYYTSRRSDR